MLEYCDPFTRNARHFLRPGDEQPCRLFPTCCSALVRDGSLDPEFIERLAARQRLLQPARLWAAAAPLVRTVRVMNARRKGLLRGSLLAGYRLCASRLQSRLLGRVGLARLGRWRNAAALVISTGEKVCELLAACKRLTKPMRPGPHATPDVPIVVAVFRHAR